MSRKRVTLREVANHAGVSIATVSYALNNSRGVGDEVLARVRASATTLGYRTDVLAQGLKAGSARLVTCIVCNLSNPFIAAAVEGASSVLRSNGYGMLVFRSGPTAQELSEGAAFATSHKSAGLLVIHPARDISTELDDWIASGNPTVVAVHPHRDVEADQVLMDEGQAGYDATQFLLEKGHGEVALISRSLKIEVYADVARGYKEALHDAGMLVRSGLIKAQNSRSKTTEFALGYHSTAELFSGDRRPTAILCAQNQIAIGALRALRDMAIEIPRDVSLMTFDRMEWMEVTQPTMCSIGIDGTTVGKLAAEALVERFSGKRRDRNVRLLPLEIYSGGSVRDLRE